MRNPIFLHSAVLFFAVISPAVAGAQFKQPTDEELKMTSDPKAPGAAAVYLDIEENDGIEQDVSTYHARIKVLTEKGKELATVEVPYMMGCEKLALVKGRTIHSDGTIVPLDAKPENLLVVKTTEGRVEKRVFTLPDVEVGSILEYSYETFFTDCDFFPFLRWELQRPYFIHKLHYAYWPPSYAVADKHGELASRLITSENLPEGVELRLNAAGHYILDLTDVPPIPDEQWMPPLRDAMFHVNFDYVNGLSLVDFWRREAQTWMESIKDFIAPGKTMRAAVANFIQPGDSDLDKAKKLYAAVQVLDNTDFSRKKTETERKKLKLKDIRRAEDIWTEQSGSGNELALLYLSMLRAAGLEAYAAAVTDRDQGRFDPNRADFDQLDTVLVILRTGGQDIYLDPGEKRCRFGMLSWKHSGASGVRETSGGFDLAGTPMPPYTQNKTLRTGDLEIDAQGAITGLFRFTLTGQAALYWRQEALEIDEGALKKEFDNELEEIVPEGVEAHVSNFLGLDDPDSVLMAVIDVKGMLGVATAKRIVLPGFFLETRGTEPFLHEEKRQTPVDMHYDAMVTDQIVYRLPTGITLEGAPPDAKELWKDHAVYTAKIRSESGKITAERTLARAFTLAKPEEYQDLRGFYQKVAAADQAQLVLDLAPAAKSN
jgi:hypothetical protein